LERICANGERLGDYYDGVQVIPCEWVEGSLWFPYIEGQTLAEQIDAEHLDQERFVAEVNERLERVLHVQQRFVTPFRPSPEFEALFGHVELGDDVVALNPANIDSLLSFPSEEIGKIDSAASIIHGMNTNMFTCGAFHVTDAGEVQSVADRIKNHILTKQFLCGSPEHLTILRVPGNYLIVLYGIKDNVGAFAQKTSALIPDTTTLTEQSLSR
jgi:hypothetical protein